MRPVPGSCDGPHSSVSPAVTKAFRHDRIVGQAAIGHWTGSTYGNPVDGASIHDANADKGRLRVIYKLAIPKTGRYEVRLSYASAPNRASNVPVTIQHADGTAAITVNQKQTPPIDALFLSLGEFSLRQSVGTWVICMDSELNTTRFHRAFNHLDIRSA